MIYFSDCFISINNRLSAATGYDIHKQKNTDIQTPYVTAQTISTYTLHFQLARIVQLV
jgi:hypothetical protein